MTTTTTDDERRTNYAKAQTMARDLGIHLMQKLPLDDAAGALISAGASLMAAGLSVPVAAGFLRGVAKQLEESRPPVELN
jgi:hypothetical protein